MESGVGADHVESTRVLPSRESDVIQSIKHKDRPAWGRLVSSEDRTDGKLGPLGRVTDPEKSKKGRPAQCMFIQRGCFVLMRAWEGSSHT